eukprot:2240080-Prymnesium_polylepis.1
MALTIDSWVRVGQGCLDLSERALDELARLFFVGLVPLRVRLGALMPAAGCDRVWRYACNLVHSGRLHASLRQICLVIRFNRRRCVVLCRGRIGPVRGSRRGLVCARLYVESAGYSAFAVAIAAITGREGHPRSFKLPFAAV